MDFPICPPTQGIFRNGGCFDKFMTQIIAAYKNYRLFFVEVLLKVCANVPDHGQFFFGTKII